MMQYRLALKPLANPGWPQICTIFLCLPLTCWNYTTPSAKLYFLKNGAKLQTQDFAHFSHANELLCPTPTPLTLINKCRTLFCIMHM